jgi:hypothetical protein
MKKNKQKNLSSLYTFIPIDKAFATRHNKKDQEQQTTPTPLNDEHKLPTEPPTFSVTETFEKYIPFRIVSTTPLILRIQVSPLLPLFHLDPQGWLLQEEKDPHNEVEDDHDEIWIRLLIKPENITPNHHYASLNIQEGERARFTNMIGTILMLYSDPSAFFYHSYIQRVHIGSSVQSLSLGNIQQQEYVIQYKYSLVQLPESMDGT